MNAECNNSISAIRWDEEARRHVTGVYRQLASKDRTWLEKLDLLQRALDTLSGTNIATSEFDLETVRQCLDASLEPEQLRRWITEVPFLRPMYPNIGPRYRFVDLVDEVLDYCVAQRLLDALIEKVEQVNPRQVAQFSAHLRAPSAMTRSRVKKTSWQTAVCSLEIAFEGASVELGDFLKPPFFEAVRTAFAEGDWDSCVAHLDVVAKLDPRDGKARRWRVEVELARQGQ